MSLELFVSDNVKLAGEVRRLISASGRHVAVIKDDRSWICIFCGQGHRYVKMQQTEDSAKAHVLNDIKSKEKTK